MIARYLLTIIRTGLYWDYEFGYEQGLDNLYIFKLIIIRLIFLYIYISGVAGTDQASKMERFDYFRGALHLACLVSSSHATVYLTTLSHVVFSGVTIASTSEMDSFFEYT